MTRWGTTSNPSGNWPDVVVFYADFTTCSWPEARDFLSFLLHSLGDLIQSTHSQSESPAWPSAWTATKCLLCDFTWTGPLISCDTWMLHGLLLLCHPSLTYPQSGSPLPQLRPESSGFSPSTWSILAITALSAHLGFCQPLRLPVCPENRQHDPVET